MGWYQDNFPGSPAAKQRIFVSRAVIGYAIICGSAIFAFAPLFRRLRRELAEGNEFAEYDFFKERRYNLKHRGWLKSERPSMKEIMQDNQLDDMRRRGDLEGPPVSPESLKLAHRQK